MVKGDKIDINEPVYPVQEAREIGNNDPSLDIAYVNQNKISWLPLDGKLSDEFIVNGDTKVISILLPMVEFNSLCSAYRLIEKIDFVIMYSLSSQPMEWFTLTDSPQSPIDIPLSELIVNTGALNNKNEKSNELKNLKERLVVVFPKYLEESLYPLIQWKKQLGLTVESFAFEELIPSKPSIFCDREEEFREWLKTKKLNLGASWTMGADYGGPVFVGNTRVGWITYSDLLEQELGRQLNTSKSIGCAVVKSSMVTTRDKWCNFTRNLIGDPSLRVWNGAPLMNNTVIECNGQIVTIATGKLEEGTISFYDGANNPHTIACESGKNMEFMVSDLFCGLNNDCMITVIEPNRLPQSLLLSNNSLLTNIQKQYVLQGGDLYNRLSETLPCFTVRSNGMLNLTSIRNINLKNVFRIENMGIANVNSLYGTVCISDDVVKEGGVYNVSGKEIVLEHGFTVEKGGLLNCSVE